MLNHINAGSPDRHAFPFCATTQTAWQQVRCLLVCNDIGVMMRPNWIDGDMPQSTTSAPARSKWTKPRNEHTAPTHSHPWCKHPFRILTGPDHTRHGYKNKRSQTHPKSQNPNHRPLSVVAIRHRFRHGPLCSLNDRHESLFPETNGQATPIRHPIPITASRMRKVRSPTEKTNPDVRAAKKEASIAIKHATPEIG